jgi:RNA polymerase sigma-70 factor, ECF subfamily
MEHDLLAGTESTHALLRRAAVGDDRARNEVFRRCIPPLQRWARGRLPPWARDLLETDDLVQETVTRSLGSIQRFEPEKTGAFFSYLRTAVRNRILDEIRRVARRPIATETIGRLRDPSPSPIEGVLGKESFQRFESALARLSGHDRELVVSRVELRLSYQEIADVVGKPSADAARMAVKRSILRLAKEMAKDE